GPALRGALTASTTRRSSELCEPDIGHIAGPNEGGFYRTQASFGWSTELKDEMERTQFKPGRESVTSRALLERATVHILDAQTDRSAEHTSELQTRGERVCRL